MNAYHGCAIWNCLKLVTAIETQQLGPKGLRFDATDTFARATRYANAQDGKLSFDLGQPLEQYSAVVELDVPECEWYSRGEGYTGSLDAVERDFKVTEARVLRVTLRPAPASRNDSTHRDVEQLKALLGKRLVILDA